MTALLDVQSLSKSFRGLQALHDVSFSVAPGEILALIGPNGAGKTTCFNAIAGAVRPDSGKVWLKGQQISGLRTDQICRAGIGRTFQIVRPFGGLDTLDNVRIGALLHSPDPAAAEREAVRILTLLELEERARVPAADLTLPERKRLEVARALATRPKILLLDEVMAGLRPAETDRMVTIFDRLNRETGLTILMTEHVMRAVMALAHRIIVLNYGQVIAAGKPEVIVRHPDVLKYYLGEGGADA